MPYPWSQSDTDIGVYQKAVAAANQEPNYYSLEGWINAQVVEKWAREHFVAPDELFSRAGAAARS